MTHDSNAPMWDGARNLADLGGLPVATGGYTTTGRVFRSAALEWMTSRGWHEARAAGLATVIDLRNDMERGRTDVHPVLDDGATAGVAIVHAPTEDPTDPRFLSECGPWLDHPRSWAGNLRLFPDNLAHAFTAIAEADGSLLIHCAGGRDRTGMVASMLLVLAGATAEAIVANYEAGFRGAARHRGHGWSYDAAEGAWVEPIDEIWTDEELEVALVDRRPTLLEWVAETDVCAYLLDAGVTADHLAQLELLLRA